MAEWRVLIADDEQAARRGVRQRLAAYTDFAVVGECRDGAEVLAALDALRPDVLFLDVQMPGIDGFEVIRRCTPERMPAVVFLTAYDQFAIRAFEAQALDYLLKPVGEERFAATMRRLVRQLRATPERASQPTVLVPTPDGATVVAANEIDWIEAADNYARVWTGGRGYLVRESIRALEARVRAHGFLRVHRGALVRIDGVRKLVRNGLGEAVAVLASGARIPIARRRRAAFAEVLRRRGT